MKKTYSWFINLMLILVFSHGISQTQDSNVTVDTAINGYKKNYRVLKNKEEIYGSLVEWVALNQESYHQEILLNLKEKIITKGNFSLELNYPLREFLKGWYDKNVDIVINYTLIISIRDGEYDVKLSLPEKVKVTQVYGPYIYTEINENVLYNKYQDTAVNREIIEADFLKQMQSKCTNRYDKKITSCCKENEELKNFREKGKELSAKYCEKNEELKEKKDVCCNRIKDKFCKCIKKQGNSKIKDEIEKILCFKKDFANSLNEKVQKLFFDNLNKVNN